MGFLSAVRTAEAAVWPPWQNVTVFPTDLDASETLPRTRAAAWVYGTATALALGALQAQQECRRRRQSGARAAPGSSAAVAPSIADVSEHEQLKPLIDNDAGSLVAPAPTAVEAGGSLAKQRQEEIKARQKELDAAAGAAKSGEKTDEPDQEREDYQRSVGFVVYHMIYCFLGFILVFWACQQQYLNKYGLDYELYAFWFIESVVTHIVCGASPMQFLSSIAPVFSERYDLMKDTVAAGIYAKLGSNEGDHEEGLHSTVGYLFALATILTVIVPNVVNILDPVAARLTRRAYWPPQKAYVQAGQLPSTLQQPSLFWQGLVALAKQLEEATREHRRSLSLLEDLPQLAIAIAFAAYARRLSPFIAMNTAITFLKAISIIFGRRFCMAWMAANDLPWPTACVSKQDIVNTVSSQSIVATFFRGSRDWELRVLKDMVSAEDATKEARQEAAHELHSHFSQPHQHSVSDVRQLIETHIKGQKAFDSVAGLIASKVLTREQAHTMASDWQAFDGYGLSSANLDRLRAVAEGKELDTREVEYRDAWYVRPLLGLMSKCLAGGSQKAFAAKALGAIATEEAADRLLSYEGEGWFTHPDFVVRKAACQAMMVAPGPQFEVHKTALAKAALEDDRQEVRKAAWRALVLQGDVGVEVLDQVLTSSNYFGDEDASVRGGACFAVQLLGMPKAEAYEQDVKKLIEDPKPAVRKQTYTALGYLGKVAELVTAVLGEREDDNVVAGLNTLGRILVAADKSETLERSSNIADLFELAFAAGRGQQVKGAARRVLAQAGASTAAELEQRLLKSGDFEDSDYSVRSDVCAVVGILKTPTEAGVEALIRVMRDDVDSSVRHFACQALQSTCASPVVKRCAPKALVEVVISDSKIPSSASRALEAFGATPEAAVYVDQMVAKLEKSTTDLVVRTSVCAVLNTLGATPEVKAHVPAIVKILKDDEKHEIRSMLCGVLGAVGGVEELQPHVPTLENLALKDKEESVADAAWDALLKLDVCRNDMSSKEFEQKLDAMTKQLKHGDWKFRRDACRAITLLVDKVADSLVEDVARIFIIHDEEKENAVRDAARVVLTRLGEVTAPGGVGQKEGGVGATSTGAAPKISSKAKDVLGKIAAKDPMKVRTEILLPLAIESISSLDPQSDLTKNLCHLMRGDGCGEIRNAAASALGCLGEKASEVPSLLTTLAFAERDFDVLPETVSVLNEDELPELDKSLRTLIKASGAAGERLLQLRYAP